MELKIPRVSFSKVLLISTLYISQSVPVSFMKTGFQVFLKNQHINSDKIGGLLGLLLLPWALKFLWAPLVDRYGSKRIGHRKSWIIPLQIAGALVLASAAFLDLESQLIQVILLFLFYSFLCATQDIAVDGLAVLSLNKKQHGIGNIFQMGGYYLGELLGGAAILIIFDQYGWTASILTLSVFFLLPLPFLLPFREKELAPNEESARPGFGHIASYLKKENNYWLFLLFIYMGNQILARTLLPSLLAERHFSESEIGFTIGVFGNAASIAGAVLGGLFIQSLGRKRSLITYGLLKIPAFFLLLVIPNMAMSHGWVIASILCNDFMAGLATVALFTVMMDKCRRESPGTDFTIQQSLNAIGVVLFVFLSGAILHSFGFTVLVISAAIIGLISVVFVWKMPIDETSPSQE